MQTLKMVGFLFLAAVLAVIALALMQIAPRIQPSLQPIVTTFEECAAAGNPIMESYPRQCRTPDGRVFVEAISDDTMSTGNDMGGMHANGCAVAGCSGQLCVSAGEAANIVTTCEYNTAYACYKEASCEPQADGTCGWTQTAQLQQCLANPPAPEPPPADLQVM